MASYYRGVQPHLRREELYHAMPWGHRGPGRPKGSRNGFSSDPNRPPVGHPAKGVLIDGRYYYNGQRPGGNKTVNTITSTPKENTVTSTPNFLERARQGITGAGRNVGNWLNQRGRDVTKTARKVGSAIGRSSVARAIGNAWDGKAGVGSGKNMAEGLRNKRDRAFAKGDTKSGVRYENAKNRAQDAYDRSIVGRLEKAGNWLNERKNEAGKAISGARKKVGAAAKNVRNAVGNAWDGQAGVGSGKSTSAGLHNKSKRAFAKGDSKSGTRYERASEKARDAYDRSIVGTAERIGKAAGKRKEQAQQFIDNFFTNIGWKKKKGHSSGTVTSTPVPRNRTYR